MDGASGVGTNGLYELAFRRRERAMTGVRARTSCRLDALIARHGVEEQRDEQRR